MKLLKAAMAGMLKQGILSVAASGTGAKDRPTLKCVLAALRYACCFHLEGGGVGSGGVGGGGEPSEVARAAWVLLEALVSLENVSVLNAKQESVKLRKVLGDCGSADFVVRCYRNKHTVGAGAGAGCTGRSGASQAWDEEDLRIFKVLEILGGNLSAEDGLYMQAQLQGTLLQMQCCCPTAAGAVAVLLQLSHAHTADADADVGAGAGKGLLKHVQGWALPLMTAARVTLQAYALRQLESRGVNTSTNTNASMSRSNSTSMSRSNTNDSNTSNMSMSMSITGAAALLPDSSELCLLLDAWLSSTTTSTTTSTSTSTTTQMLQAVQCSLFVLGELAMLGFSMEEAHVLSTDATTGAITAAQAVGAVGGGFRLCVEGGLVDLVRLLMGHELPVGAVGVGQWQGGQAQGAQGAQGGRPCPSKVRAMAFVTMGKLCLRNRGLARDNVNVLLREVVSGPSVCDSAPTSTSASASASAAVRSNALLVLGDLCIRYTNLIDRHVGTMSQCLQDSDPTVRKNALILLTQLLLQDYLKWKGFLLYRFLALTVDCDGEIAEFSRSILASTLSAKFPGLLSQHFTEALVVLNACTLHPAYASTARTVTDGGDVDADSMGYGTSTSPTSPPASTGNFTPQLTRAQRFSVYTFMAAGLDDEGKIEASARLVQDVLAAAVDSTYLLPQRFTAAGAASGTGAGGGAEANLSAFENVLEDALALLRSPLLRVGSKRTEEEEIEAEGAVNPKAAFGRAKSRVLQQLSTQHLVSHTLPVVLSLKHALEGGQSPLQGALMELLVAITKQHKGEVEAALQFDPTLRAEVEYDLKQFAAREREREQREKGERERREKERRASGAKRLSVSPPPLPKSLMKPALRKSLGTGGFTGGTGGKVERTRRPLDALRSPGMPARSVVRSALRSALGGGEEENDDENDDVDRLTYSQEEPVEEDGGA
ncbi:non-SMC mitotic condensation complex subunit 1-domain-containing protein, partial [Ochromonadaceae sp. CCMP2298]